ncbi:hypothetical protein Agub_g11440 [Astrephomene gubernaculifera]|uniref:Glycosyl transferase CAP10 domain-containing protein n=1 Tax=Astrephomene gubernaculifera TaxID=47775 RepID=A0AAD3DZB2_9CHLO|nr:hypothetical protein Agub_g11440 [Astrephomene gubernaculifera]
MATWQRLLAMMACAVLGCCSALPLEHGNAAARLPRRFQRETPAPATQDEVLVEQWDDICAKDDNDMQKLYDENLEQDLFYWRELLQGNKLNKSHLLQLFDDYGRARNNNLGAPSYISSQHNVVLIKDNHWYTPFRPFEYDTNCTREETWCDGRMMYAQWSFERWTRALGMTFPDVVFFHDIGDAGGCLGKPCAAPMLAYFRQRQEMGYPWKIQATTGDKTILMPSIYLDVGRDAVNGRLQPYSLYSFPWEKKINKAVFRGTGWCHGGKVVACPRRHLANESNFNGHNDTLDVQITGWVGPPMPYQSLSIKDHARYKYVLSLDGATASNRFAKLLGTNSVVLKEESAYIGHFYRSVQAYEHYLPILSRHPNDWLDVFDTYRDRDVELKRIVNNAQRFAARYLCDRAIALYFRRALVRYKELFSDMQDFIDSDIWPLVQEKQKMNVDFKEYKASLPH